MAVSQRPVVSTVALEREGLAATEEVLDRRFERQIRTDTVIRAVRHAGVGCEAVGARKTISAEEFLAAPFFRSLNGKAGFIEFALKNIIVVALRVEPEI